VTREEHARIRFLVSPPGTSVDDQRRRRQIGEHEFRAVQALNHDGILRPRDLVETELGVGLVYPLSTEFRPSTSGSQTIRRASHSPPSSTCCARSAKQSATPTAIVSYTAT
jgi:hypothetical protein